MRGRNATPNGRAIPKLFKTPKARSILKYTGGRGSLNISLDEDLIKPEKKVTFNEPLPEIRVKSPTKTVKEEPKYTRALALIL